MELIFAVVHGTRTLPSYVIAFLTLLLIMERVLKAVNIPAYFKSTDGHFSNWSFNLRRANLHLLPLIVENNG